MKKTLMIALAVFAMALFGSSATLADCCIDDPATDANSNGLSDCSEQVDAVACGTGEFISGYTCDTATDVCSDGNSAFSCDFGTGDCINEAATIPTLSQWGMLALVMLMLLGGTVIILRKRGAQPTA